MATHDEVRILIVEDETLQALVMKEILEGELGACVEAAACCADARGKLAAGEYDIVTLDYQLPDGNGLELLQDIVDKDDAPLVIMVTGHGDEEVAATALGLGAFGYVVKDNRMSTLLIDSVTKATVQLAMQRTERALRERQAVLQSAIETMTDLFFLIEPQGKLLAWNKRVEDLLGYSSEELSSLNIITARAGTDRPAVRDGIDLALGNNTYARYELELIAKDGTRIPFEFTGAMVLDDEGGTIGITGIGRDITERRIAEQLIEAEAQRAGLLAEVSKELAGAGSDYMHRLQVIARSIVSGIGDICGICLEAEEGGALDVVVVEHQDPEVRALLRELMANKDTRTVSGLNFYVFSTGEALLVPDFDFKNLLEEFKGVLNGDLKSFAERFGVNSLILAPMRAEGRSIGTLWVQRGTAERPFTESDLAFVNELADQAAVSIEMARMHERIQDELLERGQREKELEALNRELKGFAHTVSHDLKGPMSTMKLGLELLKERSDALSEETTAEVIDSLLRNAGRSYTLIENLLALAESGQVPRAVEDVDMLEMINRVVEDNRAELDRRGVLVRLDNAMVKVRANPTQLYQVFSNLILNAVRHNDSENPELAVSYLGEDEDGMHRYRVKDNGPGIPEGIIERIFEPFVRREGGGSGFGLAIVLSMITVYGGTIEARNDGGACFEFTIGDFPLGRD